MDTFTIHYNNAIVIAAAFGLPSYLRLFGCFIYLRCFTRSSALFLFLADDDTLLFYSIFDVVVVTNFVSKFFTNIINIDQQTAAHC